MKRMFKTITDWLLAPRRQRAEYTSIREWERIEGIKPRRVKYDWKA